MTPSFLMILLTHKCNLDCKYCYLEDKNTIPDKDEFMSFDTLSKCMTNLAVEYVKNRSENKITVQFAGGEPTLIGAKKLDEYYSEVERIFNLYDVPYSLSLITNGTTMSQDILDVLMKHSVGTCVSFDGVTGVDRYSSQQEMDAVLKGIRLIDDSGFSKSIHTVITDRTKDTFLQECFDNIQGYEGITSATYVRDPKYKLNLSADDVLEHFYYKTLQSFLDGKIKNIDGFFNVGPGRFLMRFMTDRFTYHTDMCRTSCGTRYCGGAINLAALTPDGQWQMCADFRGDEDFFNGRSYDGLSTDFLNLRKVQTNMNFLCKYIDSLRKCDNCVHQYYCEIPCMLYVRKSTGKWEIPEERCYITKKLYAWYENHLNSIFKAIYLYCPEHRLQLREDRVYKKIPNQRFDSLYFDINITDMDPQTHCNYLVVKKK